MQLETRSLKLYLMVTFCNDIEMKLLVLPIKFGGMGIVMPSKIFDDEYQNSLKITQHTKMKTIQQEMRYDHDTNSKNIK